MKANVTVTMLYIGPSMISVILHMISATDVKDIDWVSFWESLHCQQKEDKRKSMAV